MNPFATLEANLILDHALNYLRAKSFSSDNGRKSGLAFGQWINAIDAAILLIEQAQADVNTPTSTPVTILDVILVDESDVRRIAFNVLKASIADENVVALLPFNTSLELGKNFVHIVNESLYTIKTKYHDIEQAMTLCNRSGYSRGTVVGDDAQPTCPGCIAKAKGVIVNHLLHEAQGDHIRVAKALKALQK